VTQHANRSALRRYKVGAEFLAKTASFRVWAPDRRAVDVVIEGREPAPMRKEAGGYFAAEVEGLVPGARYRYRLEGGDSFPDPASRFQPDGPHGASALVDPSSFRWTDAGWAGLTLKGLVISEIHIGTFTPEGNWAAAAKRLPLLREIGINAVEVLPVAEFPGSFGWGYDGVDLFAPSHLYGTPDDFRAFVDEAHRLGIGVILDVVYNHFGPDGNYLSQFTRDYFTGKYATDWGEAINFDGANNEGVRDLVLANAAYWIDEFHLDGLRLDATQSINDDSPRHIMSEIVSAARRAACARSIVTVAENEPQETRLIRPQEIGGYGIDAIWNDDFHHSAMVAMTGHRRAYYSDHHGAPSEFIAAAKRGFLFQGQRYDWQLDRRGTPSLDLHPAKFVTFVQNHDQIANTADGRRFHLLTSPGRGRAMTALMLLGPGTPMLFQGQEFFASARFFYFADHKPELAAKVRAGRGEFLRQFPNLDTEEMQAILPDPADRDNFERCMLDWSERETNEEAVALHRDLLRLRKDHPVFADPRPGGVDGVALGDEAFLLRFFGQDGDDRLLVVNLGIDLALPSIADPLSAPPAGKDWTLIWSSEAPAYGGHGTPSPLSELGWFLPGHAAAVLAPGELRKREPAQEQSGHPPRSSWGRRG
jgi:maltooligosyltrehalose trehalohydrolase